MQVEVLVLYIICTYPSFHSLEVAAADEVYARHIGAEGRGRERQCQTRRALRKLQARTTLDDTASKCTCFLKRNDDVAGGTKSNGGGSNVPQGAQGGGRHGGVGESERRTHKGHKYLEGRNPVNTLYKSIRSAMEAGRPGDR